jgi:hypothetical protein
VIVAVVGVREVQPSLHEIVDVVAVGHSLVAAAGTVHVVRRMPGRRARVAVGVLGVDLDRVLVDVVAVRVMEVAVVQIVDVVGVPHRRVAAAGTVLMRVLLVDGMAHAATVGSPRRRCKRLGARGILSLDVAGHDAS